MFFFVNVSIPSKPGLEFTSQILYPPLSNSKSTPAISKSNAFDDSDDNHSICSLTSYGNPSPPRVKFALKSSSLDYPKYL